MKKIILGFLFALTLPVMAKETQLTEFVKLDRADLKYRIEGTKTRITDEFSQEKRRTGEEQLTSEDFLGRFVWNGFNARDIKNLRTKGVLSIMRDPESSDSLLISGFYNDYILKGYVENNRLYIPNQKIRYNDYYEMDMWFWNVSVRNPKQSEDQESYYYNISPEKPFYLSMTDGNDLIAGNIDLDMELFDNFKYSDEELADMVCVATVCIPSIAATEGFHWDCAWIEASPLNTYFNFDESEWTYVGDATFKDAWLPQVWNIWDGGSVAIYDVPLYRYNNDENRFLLRDPYGPNTQFGRLGYNLKAREGHIIFNISDPDFVVFEPFIYACTTKTWGDIPGESVEIYPYNSEGHNLYLYDNVTDEFLLKDLNGSSVLSPGNHVIEIRNALYGRTEGENFLSGRYQLDYDRTGYIVLPNDYNGVNDIMDDSAIPSVEYYDLQGIKINNPTKGRMFIVKRGNKTSKELIR